MKTRVFVTSVLSFLFIATNAHSQSRYCLPQIADGGFSQGSFRTSFVLFNNNDTSAAVSLRLTDDSGNPLTVTIPGLGTNSQFTINLVGGASRILQTDGMGALRAGAATISASASIAVSAIFTVCDRNGNFVTEAGVGDSQPITESVLPMDATEDFNTGLAMFNPSNADAAITLIMRHTDGAEVARTALTLKSGCHFSGFLAGPGQLFPQISNLRGSLVVQSSQPVSALCLRQNSTQALPRYTSLPITPLSSSRTSMIFPQVANGLFDGGSFKTSFLIVNISNSPANAVLTLTKDDGSPLPVTIPGFGTGSSFTIPLSTGAAVFLQTDGAGALAAGAASITSNSPIGASGIFSVFDGQGRLQTETGVGDSPVLSDFTLPIDAHGDFDTGIAVYNPTNTDSSVDFQLFDANGILIDRIVQGSLKSRNHTALFFTQLFDLRRDFTGTLAIHAWAGWAGAGFAAMTLRQNSSPLSYTTLPVSSGATKGQPDPADITPLLSLAGLWNPIGLPNMGLVNFWGIAGLGPNQLQGVVLAGWVHKATTETSDVTPVSIAVLAQQLDGTLKLSTDQYLDSAVINGTGSVVIADFNGDGKDDIFLAAHNESPPIGKPSTVYLSKPDSTFSKLTLADGPTAHDANLAYINGTPTVLTATYGNAPPTPSKVSPIYTYNGHGDFDINTAAAVSGCSSVAAGDLLNNGSTQIVYGDFIWGPNYPNLPTNIPQQFIYQYIDNKLQGYPIPLPPPYFNDKPQYSQYKSFRTGLTHNARLWIDDINHDGLPDIIVGALIWDPDIGWQKTMLQLLVNQGGLHFEDRSDQLNPQYDQNAYYDYSLRMADVDKSGINTYFMARDPDGKTVNGQSFSENGRHGNYILVNDGTGRMHVAMHDEFRKTALYVNQYLLKTLTPSSLGGRYWAGAGGMPRFIAYQTPDGAINFVALAHAAELVNNEWIDKMALVNVPIRFNLKTDYLEDLTILDRNGSHLIRTFAGNDVIYSGNDGGYCAIDGGLGLNTIVYSGKQNNYTVTKTTAGYTVKDNVGNDGTDTLINIQILRFTDMTIDLRQIQ